MLRDRFLGAALQGRASQRLALVLEGQILDAGDGILRRHAEIVDELTVSPLGQRLVLQFRHQEPIRRAVIVIGPGRARLGYSDCACVARSFDTAPRWIKLSSSSAGRGLLHDDLVGDFAAETGVLSRVAWRSILPGSKPTHHRIRSRRRRSGLRRRRKRSTNRPARTVTAYARMPLSD